LMSFPSPVVVVLDSPTPTANGHFGSAVATAGNSVVVVGAPGERGDGLEGAGTVYRFNSDGTALQPIKNPSPAPNAGFGASVATDSDLVLVGAPGSNDPNAIGSAYLFDPAGTAHALNRPAPSAGALFGAAVTLSGSDAFIGAPFEGGEEHEAGAVYLFEADPASPTFGELVRTFANPRSSTPLGGIGDGFGTAVAAMDGLLVVGAPFATARAAGDGIVYVFDTRRSKPTFGQLLATIPNPSPSIGAAFGSAVAIVGGRILVGAPFDDSDAIDGGAVYQFEAR